MALLKAKKVKEMNEKELQDKLKEFRLELSKDLASAEIGTLKNSGKLKETKKAIARILTHMSTKNQNKKGDEE